MTSQTAKQMSERQQYGVLKGYSVRAVAGYSGEIHYDILDERGDFIVGCTDWKNYIPPNAAQVQS